MHPLKYFFGYKHFQFTSNISLYLSDSIAVPVHYWLYHSVILTHFVVVLNLY